MKCCMIDSDLDIYFYVRLHKHLANYQYITRFIQFLKYILFGEG